MDSEDSDASGAIRFECSGTMESESSEVGSANISEECRGTIEPRDLNSSDALISIEETREQVLEAQKPDRLYELLVKHDERLTRQDESLVKMEKMIRYRHRYRLLLVLLLGLVLTGVAMVSVLYGQNTSIPPHLFIPPRLETLNATKDIDADELPWLRQRPRNGSDNEFPDTSTLLPMRTTTATPTTYKHWDWRTNCGVQPLNRTGSFGVWPWQVLVRKSTYLGRGEWEIENKCGGVLLNNKFVLIPAHCQSDGSNAGLSVELGDYTVTENYETKSEVMLRVNKVFVHPNYEAGTFDNDLALLELDRPVPFQEHIIPVCLPNDEMNNVGGVATVAGWGSPMHGDSLMGRLPEVQLHIITNSDCQDWFQEKNMTKDIKPELMCAGYRNSCEGDSGGPLTLRGPDGRWVLVGAVSQGIKCAKPILPGMYMRMSHYRPWIEDIINA